MKNETHTLLRINNNLYEEIKRLAKEQKRSIHSQILYILQKYIDMIQK